MHSTTCNNVLYMFTLIQILIVDTNTMLLIWDIIWLRYWLNTAYERIEMCDHISVFTQFVPFYSAGSLQENDSFIHYRLIPTTLSYVLNDTQSKMWCSQIRSEQMCSCIHVLHVIWVQGTNVLKLRRSKRIF